MFKIGEYVSDKNTHERVQIVDVSTVWGFVSYKVFNPVTDVVYMLSADAVEAETRQVNANEFYLRYVAMLSKIKSETSEGILSKLSSGVIPLPHQLHVLNRAVSDNNIRYILIMKEHPA